MLKLFLNPDISAHLRGLATEFGESSNSIRVELNRLTDAGMLESQKQGRTIAYKANKNHMLFPEISSIVRKYTGLDQIVEGIVNQLGEVEMALITGDYARGYDSGLVDLVIVGQIDYDLLNSLVQKSECIINRKIRTLVLNMHEFDTLKGKMESDSYFIIWNSQPAIV